MGEKQSGVEMQAERRAAGLGDGILCRGEKRRLRVLKQLLILPKHVVSSV